MIAIGLIAGCVLLSVALAAALVRRRFRAAGGAAFNLGSVSQQWLVGHRTEDQ